MSTRSTQLTIGANDQRKIAIRVESIAKRMADKTHMALAERMPPILEAGESLDFRLISSIARRWLVWRRQRLDAAEAVYASELRADQRLRMLRDEALQALIESLRLVQARLDHALGRGRTASFAGFSKGLQDLDPQLLMQVAAQAMEELRRGDFGLDREKLIASNLDREDLVATIEQPLAALTRVLEELPDSLASTEATLEEKQAELGRLNQDIRHIGGFLAAGYRLAGLDFHAERLRPKARVAGEAEEEEELSLPVDGAPEAEVKTAANDAQPIAVAS